jgi:branched-chain amino acid transport system substrate-binding protein
MRVRSQLSTRRKTLIVIAAGGIALSACGTRLPDKDFSLSQGQAVAGPAQSTGPSATGTTGPAAPTTNNGASTGTAGHTVTSGGSAGSGSQKVSGNAAPADFSTLCGPAPAGQKNTASDIGVTPTSITVGNITSDNNPFGSDQFSPNHWGAYAFSQYCNARGGINGRQISFQHCNDGGTNSGNVTCVNGLVNKNAFAFIGDNCFQCGGAQTMNSKDRPDIGGEPIDGAAYYTYPHMYNILGDGYPKDGKHTGYQNQYWGLPQLGLWFKAHVKLQRVAIVYYDEIDSQRGAAQIALSLGAAGIQTKSYAVQISGTPDSAVTAMQHDGMQAIFDALDDTGNIKLCDSMQNHQPYNWLAKVSTISTWTAKVGAEFNSLCQKIMYSAGSSSNYADSSNPVAAEFRQDFARYAGGQTPAQWALEGYISGIWFAQAVKSCGAGPTRACVEKWLNDQKSLSAYGLMDPTTSFQKVHYSTGLSAKACNDVVKWNGSTWTTQVDVGDASGCYTSRYFHYNTS